MVNPPRLMVGLAVAALAATIGSGCRGKDDGKMADGYVAIEDLWRTAPESRGGENESLRMPARGASGPEYVSYLNGFRARTPNAPGGETAPSTVRHIDARTGSLIRDEPYTGRGVDFERTSPSDAHDRYARLAKLTDALAPAFFAGEPSVPAALRPQAAQWRADFLAVEAPESIRYYVEIAPEWAAWIGIAAHARP